MLGMAECVDGLNLTFSYWIAGVSWVHTEEQVWRYTLRGTLTRQ
jgi:hypothetical protein